MKVRILKAHDYVLLGSGIKQGGVYEATNLKFRPDDFGYGVEIVCPETYAPIFFNYEDVRFICPAECIKLGMPKPYLTGANVCATTGTKGEK